MLVKLSDKASAVIESGALAHFVTVNPDGSPQVAIIWVGLDGDELVAAHLFGNQQKLHNIRRDPRVAISFEASGVTEHGLDEYLVVRGEAYITEGGAPELLQRLAHVYMGPDVIFPNMEKPPPGFVTHVRVTKVGGAGFS
ncbi:MAG TPA: PPOX class F420-dependent oxidoreductase [Acidimicrobiales bacterium]|jgi:PPOX class probable F420-dependent enzyme|nr:PPOX class F420-dependent oxidoreductase [Acidimicrobiales bacterium]